jgi:hypothetical protein
MACAAPAWYKSLSARRPRRAALKNAAADDQMIALVDKRTILVAEYEDAVAYRARTVAQLGRLAAMTAALHDHAAEAVVQCYSVAAYRAKVISRLTDEAIEASLSGDFTKSRNTMRHLDKVTDRQRVLGERVASDVESLRKAAFVTADHESRIDAADRTKLLCAESLNWLGTWALPTTYVK